MLERSHSIKSQAQTEEKSIKIDCFYWKASRLLMRQVMILKEDVKGWSSLGMWTSIGIWMQSIMMDDCGKYNLEPLAWRDSRTSHAGYPGTHTTYCTGLCFEWLCLRSCQLNSITVESSFAMPYNCATQQSKCFILAIHVTWSPKPQRTVVNRFSFPSSREQVICSLAAFF